MTQQISLKIKSYTNNVNIIDNSNNLQKRLLQIMLWTLGFLSLLYVIMLGNMVFNIVERKALEAYAHDLSNQVGILELDYFSLSQKVDLSLAHSLGFKEIKTKYATRQALGSVNISKNEI